MKIIKYMSLFTFLLSSCKAQTSNDLLPTKFAKAIIAKNVQILDVRTKEEFSSGHIKNALQADWTNKNEFKNRTETLNKETALYVYCLSGGRSKAAAAQLRNEGYKVYELKGGMVAWNNAALPTEGIISEKGMTIDEYKKMIHSYEIVLVDFSAKWCAPCVKMKSILESFSKKITTVKVLSIDIDKNREVATTLKIAELPTFYLYKNGIKEKEKLSVMNATELIEFVK